MNRSRVRSKPMRTTLPHRVRLGAFEVDLRAGELRDGERTVRLQEQPFQILLMLIARGGEVITREEIRKKLWPNDTVVEFDHSINAAIKKLRQVLGDSAEVSSYVETVARRGYRLLVPVEHVASDYSSDTEILAGAPVKQPSGGTDLIGRKVSHYRVLEVIGGGGMGMVYRAEDLKLGRQVALKFLPDELAWDPVALQRFEREARAASSLDHPNICTIHAVEEHDGEPFIVMQLLQGETLRDRLSALRAAQMKLDLDVLLEISIEICNGLQAAHAKGIIHRDIKPANIFLITSGRVKILDFGLAKLVNAAEESQTDQPATEEAGAAAAPQLVKTTAVDATLTRFGVAVGTAGYMSPEQVRGEELDARTDIFSFGLVLYEMATGQRAFSGETAAVVHDAIVNQVPAPVRERNSTIPQTLEKIINRAIEKDRERRYQSAADVLLELQQSKLNAHRGVSVAKGYGNIIQHETPAVNRRSSRIVASLVVFLIASLIGGGLYYRSRPVKRLTEKETIVLGDFTNRTGDAVFDDTLKTALNISLGQSPFLNVLPEDKIRSTLQLMTRPVNSVLTPDLVRELCLRTGSQAYIAGSIASLGSEYVLGLKAVNCENGDVLAQQQFTARTKEQVLDALGQAAVKLRGDLGESLSTVQKFDVPLPEATTSSLEALKEYSLGLRAHRETGRRADLAHYERAAQLDPSFAMAYRAAAWDYRDLGEVDRSVEYYTKAFELREHASDREKLLITADYYLWVLGALDRALQAYQGLAESYPRYSGAYFNLANVYAWQGQYEKAGDAYRESLRLIPEERHGYDDLVTNLLCLQRFGEVRQVISDRQARGEDSFVFRLVLYEAAFLAEDSPTMAEQERWFAARPSYASLGLDLGSDSAAYKGRLREARALRQQAVDSAVRSDQNGNAAVYLEDAAVLEGFFGNAAEAKRAATAGLKLVPSNKGVEVEAALALAIAGDAARSQSLAVQLNKRYPIDTQVQSLWLPAVQAQLALHRKNAASALETLQAALPPIEWGNIVFINNASCLYHTYVRGYAYLQAGQGSAAAAEFQKIVNHSGIVGNCPTGALAHLGLARAYALQFRTAEGADADAARTSALAVYKTFLTLWKDADPDIPIYKQAKAEYANLQ